MHILAEDEQKARRVAERVVELFDRPFVMHQVERYWKISEQQVVTGEMAIDSATLPDAVVEVLQAASRVAGHWSVGAPEHAADGSWQFDGAASAGFRVAGVVFAAWWLSPAGRSPSE